MQCAAFGLRSGAGDAAAQVLESTWPLTLLRGPRTACRRPRHGSMPNLPCVQHERCKVKDKLSLKGAGSFHLGSEKSRQYLL